MRAATLLAVGAAPLAMAASTMKRAPLVQNEKAELVEGQYIVKLKAGSDFSVASSLSVETDRTFKRFNGFSAKLSAEQLESIRAHPSVSYVEQDAIVKISGEQSNAPWGLARLSSTEPGATTYSYDDSAGSGVCAYIIDTGIDVEHEDFGGRAEWLTNTVDNDDTDGHGHGSHVAGTVGGTTSGVSKSISLFAVKVLDSSGSGTNSAIISGMEFVADDSSSRDCPSGAVANMSLGGSYSAAVNEAAAGVVDAGVFLAVAAGNGNAFGVPQDANDFSPASETSACTVGATDDADAVASFSNYGTVVDIHAPGVDIESVEAGGSYVTMSGTSMASPHIAGLAGYFMGTGDATAADACEYIASVALSDVITGLQGNTANLLAQNGQA